MRTSGCGGIAQKTCSTYMFQQRWSKLRSSGLRGRCMHIISRTDPRYLGWFEAAWHGPAIPDLNELSGRCGHCRQIIGQFHGIEIELRHPTALEIGNFGLQPCNDQPMEYQLSPSSLKSWGITSPVRFLRCGLHISLSVQTSILTSWSPIFRLLAAFHIDDLSLMNAKNPTILAATPKTTSY